MRCEEAQILLSTRRDLSGSQRAELDAHLGTCRLCAAARREEDRVSRLLAALPEPSLAAPPRVAAAIATRAAQRSLRARRRRGLALAASLGAAACVVALLLNIVAGGRLGWMLFGRPAEGQSAAAPAAPTWVASGTGAPARDDVLYLIHRPGQGDVRLIAWEPATDRTVFSVPLGDPPDFIISDQATRVTATLPPRDVVVAPDGRPIFVIEYGASIDLVAYAARDGAELWRTPLTGYAPYIAPQSGGALSVSPDGARVFVRGVVPQQRGHVDLPLELELRAFATDDGRQLGAATRIPDEAAVLPLSQHDVLAYRPEGEAARVVLGLEGPWFYLQQSVAAPVLLPNWRTVRAVIQDLQVVDLALVGDTLRVTSEIDLIERGAFFFNAASFSPDGEVLAVGQSTWDAQTGAVGSEIRIYRAEPWREVARHTTDRPLVELVVSADGARVYAALGRAGTVRPPVGRSPAPTTPPGGAMRGALLTFDATTGQLLRTQELDQGIVGMLAGR